MHDLGNTHRYDQFQILMAGKEIYTTDVYCVYRLNRYSAHENNTI